MFDLTGSERSPLEALSRVRFGGRTFLQSTRLAVSTSPQQIIKNNPNRVFWLLENNGANDLNILPGGDALTGAYIVVRALGGSVSMSWDEDGEAVGYDWNGFFVTSGSSVRILEVIRE